MLCLRVHIKPEEGIAFPEARVTGVCELLNVGVGGSSFGPMEEQQVLLIVKHLFSSVSYNI